MSVGFLSTVVHRVLFSRVSKQSRKRILSFPSITLVNWVLAFCLFKCLWNSSILVLCAAVIYRQHTVAREEVFHCKLLGPVPRCFA